MPGSGINQDTVTPVVQELLPKGLREIHLSSGKWRDSKMQVRREGMNFGASVEHEWSVWGVDRKRLQRVRAAADLAWDQYWHTVGGDEHV